MSYVDELSNTSQEYDIMKARVNALANVNVYGDKQAEAVNIAAGAIKAHHRGPNAYNAYVKELSNNGTNLHDALLQLYHLPEDQTESAASAIEFAKRLLRHEEYKQVLECSVSGDKRFCPTHAKLTIGGKTASIDRFYQEAKRTADGKQAKRGEPFDHMVDPYTGDKFPASEAPWFYRGLWIEYFTANPDLVKYAEEFEVFSNFHTRKGLENRYDEIIRAYVKGDRKRYVDVVKCSDWYKNMSRKTKTSLSSKIKNAAGRTVDPASCSDSKKNHETSR